MSQAVRPFRMLAPVRLAASVLRTLPWTLTPMDPEGLRYIASLQVWGHWMVFVICAFLLAYRPVNWPGDYAVYVPMFAFLVVLNGVSHYRLAKRKTVKQHWILGILAADIAAVSIAIIAGGGFDHYFLYLLYYAPLAGYAMVMSSLRMTLAGVTLVAALYLVISLVVGDGIDTGAREEKPLLVRILVMYAVAAFVQLVSHFERTRWQAAVDRERALQREQISLSQSIHDTTAQSAYLINLGIESARQVAGEGNKDLKARLEAMSRLSKATIWQLRRPIDVGRIFEGRELCRTLDSHVATFTSVTSVPAVLRVTGEEPPLSIEAKSMLFTIAHNALTNAFRHAEAKQVRVNLDFSQDELRLSVKDDGLGLPQDYDQSGQGFTNMRADATRLGGELIVEPRGSMGGASITCVLGTNGNGREA